MVVPAIASARSEGDGVRRSLRERVNSAKCFHVYKMAESREVEEMQLAEKLQLISRNLQVCVREM